jgi:hypothetical protein
MSKKIGSWWWWIALYFRYLFSQLHQLSSVLEISSKFSILYITKTKTFTTIFFCIQLLFILINYRYFFWQAFRGHLYIKTVLLFSHVSLLIPSTLSVNSGEFLNIFPNFFNHSLGNFLIMQLEQILRNITCSSPTTTFKSSKLKCYDWLVSPTF